MCEEFKSLSTKELVEKYYEQKKLIEVLERENRYLIEKLRETKESFYDTFMAK